jgi:hypothetical protein
LTLEGRAQSLLRQGRHLWRGADRRRPPSGRRGSLLFASCVAALVVAPHALADTSTTPAPDPNPPAGAAPDPYTPPAKAPPPRTPPAPVHTVPHVYSPPAYTPPAQTVPVQHVTRAVVPAAPTRPAVHRAKPAVHKARHRPKRRRVVVHHKPKPVVVRLTPRAEAYVSSVVKTMSAAVATPSNDSGAPRRRRAAGLALFVLAAGSLGLVFLAARSRRTLSA